MNSRAPTVRRYGYRIAATMILFAAITGFARASVAEQGLYSPDGASTTLDAHLVGGDWMVVMLWATNCSICVTEFPKFSRLHEEGHGRRVLGIALDGANNGAAVDAFYARTGAKFPTLLADLSVYRGSYRTITGEELKGTPTFMLYNPEGRLVGLNLGPMRVEALERFIDRKR